jgi:hypothetical protein
VERPAGAHPRRPPAGSHVENRVQIALLVNDADF